MKSKKCRHCKKKLKIKEFLVVRSTGLQQTMKTCSHCRKASQELYAQKLAEAEANKHLACDVLSDFLRGSRSGVMIS